MSETATETVKRLTGCARCGGEHENIEFKPLTMPCEPDQDGTQITHWAPCPTNGEPILMGYRVKVPCGG